MAIKKVLVSGHPKNEVARKTAKKVIKLLVKHGIKAIVDKTFLPLKNAVSIEKADADAAVVFGGDGTLLHFLRESGKRKIPVLGINCGARGNLMEAGHSKIDTAVGMLAKGYYTLAQKQRIAGTADGRELPLALNDIMLSPKKPAVLFRHDIFIDKEFLFRDISDALLVSSVTGSTAYSLSGSNPVAHEKARVLIVRPVNSHSHPQPVVVNENSTITIDNIDSPIGLEAIIDGQERVEVKNRLVIRKAKAPVNLIKFKKQLAEEKEHLKQAMPSAKYIYWVLKEKGSLTQLEIIKETGLNWRTAKRALDFLVRHEIVVKQPLFWNRKQRLYSVR